MSTDAQRSLIDVDNPRTWPKDVAEFVAGPVERMRGVTEFTPDLNFVDRNFNQLLGNRPLLAFHATRLFDHEVEGIKREGLRRLTPDLVSDRIRAAYERGLLAEHERDRCLSRNVYAIDNYANRENRICSVIGRQIFDHEQGLGLHPLLGGWGGEAMNGGPGPHADPVLQRLGHPAIVVMALDIAEAGFGLYAAPALEKVFVGRRMGLEDAFGEVHAGRDIPPEAVIDIWQPGHPDYDRHTSLPRG